MLSKVGIPFRAFSHLGPLVMMYEIRCNRNSRTALVVLSSNPSHFWPRLPVVFYSISVSMLDQYLPNPYQLETEGYVPIWLCDCPHAPCSRTDWITLLGRPISRFIFGRYRVQSSIIIQAFLRFPQSVPQNLCSWDSVV